MSMNRIIAWLFVAVGILGIAVLLLGCNVVAPRVTNETYFPGDPPLVVVEWPEGVTQADLWITEVHGRPLVVGPAESVY
jgi:hypothetical protein